MKSLAKEWHDMPQSEKQQYFEQAEADKYRYEEDLREIVHKKVERKNLPPEIETNKDGVPKRPPSAYVMFAKEVRSVLKRKMPNCSFSDVMKAVSIDWVKLSKEKKAEYYGEARRLKVAYHQKYNEWIQANGPK